MTITTAGPWKYESGMVWTEDGRQVLRAVREWGVGIPPDERDANCRAAAAIPEMLSACNQLVAAYEAGKENGGSMDWNDVDLAFEHAKAALAKVEGRTS